MSQHQLAEDKQKAKLPEAVSVNEIGCQGAMKVRFLQSAVRAIYISQITYKTHLIVLMSQQLKPTNTHAISHAAPIYGLYSNYRLWTQTWHTLECSSASAAC